MSQNAPTNTEHDRPAKRLRGVHADQIDTDTVERHSKFWFGDGTAVLQAENLQFRIHRGVLEARSTVFRDMFAIPHRTDDPSVEGSPLVVLTGDAAVDWAVILEIFYYSSIEVSGARQLSDYLSVLRLAKKYDMPDLLRGGMTFIRELLNYPTGYPVVPELIRSVEAVYHLAEVIEDLGIEVLLPPILFIIELSFSTTQISDGFHTASGDILTLPTHLRQKALCGRDEFILTLRNRWRWLSECKIGKFCVPTPSCTQKATCAIELDFRSRQFRTSTKFIGLSSSISEWSICDSCLSELCSKADTEIQEFYIRDFLGIFNLPHWDELVEFSH